MLIGCAIPIPYAPHTTPLSDDPQVQPLIAATFGQNWAQGTDSPTLALRNGRSIVVADQDKLLPPAILLPDTDSRIYSKHEYVTPPSFSPVKTGDWHLFGFRVTPEFEVANSAYIGGNAIEALTEVRKILANEHEKPSDEELRLLWQASYLKVMSHALISQMDLAEHETQRLERFEMQTFGTNIYSRSVRAEIRFWSGDLDGATNDATKVIKELGGWRFPTIYPAPVLDQSRLSLATAAQARADVILGWVLMKKEKYGEALPWLELADNTMNDIAFVKRLPFIGWFVPDSQEL